MSLVAALFQHLNSKATNKTRPCNSAHFLFPHGLLAVPSAVLLQVSLMVDYRLLLLAIMLLTELLLGLDWLRKISGFNTYLNID